MLLQAAGLLKAFGSLNIFFLNSCRQNVYLVCFSMYLFEIFLFCYACLQSAGLLKAFGSLDIDVVPAKTRDMSPEKLMDLTGMNVQNLAPGRPTGSWAVAVRFNRVFCVRVLFLP